MESAGCGDGRVNVVQKNADDEGPSQLEGPLVWAEASGLDGLALEAGLLAGEGGFGAEGLGRGSGEGLGAAVGVCGLLAESLKLLLFGAEAGGAPGSCGWDGVTHAAIFSRCGDGGDGAGATGRLQGRLRLYNPG